MKPFSALGIQILSPYCDKEERREMEYDGFE